MQIYINGQAVVLNTLRRKRKRGCEWTNIGINSSFESPIWKDFFDVFVVSRQKLPKVSTHKVPSIVYCDIPLRPQPPPPASNLHRLRYRRRRVVFFFVCLRVRDAALRYQLNQIFIIAACPPKTVCAINLAEYLLFLSRFRLWWLLTDPSSNNGRKSFNDQTALFILNNWPFNNLIFSLPGLLCAGAC